MLLHLVLDAELHVVAQVVEAELARGAVDRVAAICAALLLVALHVHRVNGADGEPQRAEERKHPVAVALHEIVVHGHDMHLLAVDRSHEARERRDDRLAFARLHFGDLPLEEHHAADDLHIKGARPEGRSALGVQHAHRVVERDRDVDELPGRDRACASEEILLGFPRHRGVNERPRLVVEPSRLRGQHGGIEPLIRRKIGIEDVADAHGPVHRFARHGEHIGGHVRELLPGLHPSAKVLRPRTDVRVGEPAHLLFALRHLSDHAQVPLDHALVARAENDFGELAEHGNGHWRAPKEAIDWMRMRSESAMRQGRENRVEGQGRHGAFEKAPRRDDDGVQRRVGGGRSSTRHEAAARTPTDPIERSPRHRIPGPNRGVEGAAVAAISPCREMTIGANAATDGIRMSPVTGTTAAIASSTSRPATTAAGAAVGPGNDRVLGRRVFMVCCFVADRGWPCTISERQR